MAVPPKQNLVRICPEKQRSFALPQNTDHTRKPPFFYKGKGVCHDGIPEFSDQGELFEIINGCLCQVGIPAAFVVDHHLMIIVPFYPENIVLAQQACTMIGRFRMSRITDVAKMIDGFTTVFLKQRQGISDTFSLAVAVSHDADFMGGFRVYGSHLAFGCHLSYRTILALRA